MQVFNTLRCRKQLLSQEKLHLQLIIACFNQSEKNILLERHRFITFEYELSF